MPDTETNILVPTCPACGAVAVRRGYTVTEAFLPARADRAVVAVLRRWFGDDRGVTWSRAAGASRT